jgi:hypothetical protein
MRRLDLVRNLLAVLVIAGLVFAPLAASAGAQATSGQTMSAMTDEAMAEDMPCCPTDAPVPMNCHKCILMAACSGISVAPLPQSFVNLQVISSCAQLASPIDDLQRAGLTHPPPAKPPRNPSASV